ncbi:DUF5343 domain-containing protein [Treponema sp. HNW]|uniref:DUF5343 domain-containing protein n=1 Tax=Treponema sp. HNW TaxID=3116654 RepID=UPI003D0A1DB8
MNVNLPYLAAPGSIITCLERIKTASTPDRVTTDFVNTILQIKGGTGNAIIPYLKKIGLVSSDGSPTDLYRQFRNNSNGGIAIAEAIKKGYRPLLEANEYFHKLNDTELKDLIIQVTGLDKDNASIKLISNTLKNLKTFALFEDNIDSDISVEPKELQIPLPQPSFPHQEKIGLNLSYTINLNLPNTTDQSVFNAIFKSLKENLLSNE